jgi:hypothetical protein
MSIWARLADAAAELPAKCGSPKGGGTGCDPDRSTTSEGCPNFDTTCVIDVGARGRYTAIISGRRSEPVHGSHGMRPWARALLNSVSSHSA